MKRVFKVVGVLGLVCALGSLAYICYNEVKTAKNDKDKYGLGEESEEDYEFEDPSDFEDDFIDSEKDFDGVEDADVDSQE